MNTNLNMWKRTAGRAILAAAAGTGLGLTGCDKDQIEAAAGQSATAMSPSEYLASGLHTDDGFAGAASMKLAANHNETFIVES